MSGVVATPAGFGSGLAIGADGRVVAWDGKTVLPSGLSNILSISVHGVALALKNDGTVVAWGGSQSGQVSVPAGLSNVVAVSSGGGYSLALKRDGTVVGWGGEPFFRGVPSGVSNIVAIAATPSSNGYDVALRNDSTVVEWSLYGFIEVGRDPVIENGVVVGYSARLVDVHAVEGLSNVVAIAVGDQFGTFGPPPGYRLALKSDGTVFGWGANGGGQATGVATTNAPYQGSGLVKVDGQVLSNVVAIAAGYCGLALKNDGTLVSWGSAVHRPAVVPPGLSNVVAIAARDNSYFAVMTNATAANSRR
jgi:alpha-tubulin suppressor-like RCC1 family protein